jgi:hypothetical protein
VPGRAGEVTVFMTDIYMARGGKVEVRKIDEGPKAHIVDTAVEGLVFNPRPLRVRIYMPGA